MTVAMSRLHEKLPRPKRYPLPPRELSEDLPALGVGTATATLVHHSLYGQRPESCLAHSTHEGTSLLDILDRVVIGRVLHDLTP